MGLQLVQVAADVFGRADDANIGTGWTEEEGEGELTFQIATNRLQARTGDTNSFFGRCMRTDTYLANQYCQCTFDSQVTGEGNVSGPVVRGSGNNASFSGYAILWGTTAVGDSSLVKLVNANLGSTGSGLTTLAGGLTFSNGQVVGLRVIGGTIQVFRAGALLTTALDAAIATGVPGIVSPRHATQTFSRFFTAWTSGNIILPNNQGIVT